MSTNFFSKSVVTMDVSSLHTNTPHNDGINSLNSILNKADYDLNLINYIKRATECILKNNNFIFDDKHYLQLTGTAMGTRMSPKYANIFMADFETQLMSATSHTPLKYFRFIDDIFMIWTAGLENLEKFIETANNRHPSIKFTHECSASHISFLDTTVHLINNNIETEIFTKPTDSHLYLLPSSCHPRHVTNNLPYSLALRIKRICSTDIFFQKHIEQLKLQLIKRNYKITDIDRSIQRINDIPREDLLTGPSNRNNNNNL